MFRSVYHVADILRTTYQKGLFTLIIMCYIEFVILKCFLSEGNDCLHKIQGLVLHVKGIRAHTFGLESTYLKYNLVISLFKEI